MMTQGDVLPNKTLVMNPKSKSVRQNELALLQKSKSINDKLTEQAIRAIAEARGKRKISVCRRITWSPHPVPLWPAVQR